MSCHWKSHRWFSLIFPIQHNLLIDQIKSCFHPSELLTVFLQLFKSLPSTAMPGLHSEELRLRVLFLHFEKPGRIFKLKQVHVSLTQCMGQPPNLDRIGFKPGSMCG